MRAPVRPLSWLTADGKKLLVARILRSFAYGYVAVVLALYLRELGLDEVHIGVVLTAAILGSAIMTIAWALVADGFGRRRTVQTMALLMVAGGLLFAVAGDLWLLLLGASTGTISATSSEVGAFLTVEQAVLPQTAPPEKQTWLFSLSAMAASFAQAAGSLFAGTATFLAASGQSGADAFRPLFILYALIGLANLGLFLTLSDRVELAHVPGAARFLGVQRSAGIVARLSLLFGLDSFAGALVVQSLVAYWFHLRWGLDAAQLGALFFGVNILSGLSLLAASWLASRIGLIRTMVYTHLPSNILLIGVPLMPTAQLAVALFLVRMSISQMDVPTRQSYTMAVVDPGERTAAAGITNVTRSLTAVVSPLVTGYAFSLAALGFPFFLSGGLKVIYDLILYRTFAGVRTPLEERRRAERLAAD